MAERVKKKEKLHDLMDTFLDRDRPGDSQLEAALESLLAADRAFEKPESDLESTKEFRYECAARIQERIRTLYYYKDYQQTVVEVAIILDVPRTCLEPKGWLDPDQDASTLQGKLFDIGWLVGHFLLKFKEDREDTQSTDVTVPGSGANAQRPVSQRRDEKDVCRDRDGRKCIQLGTSSGEAAHILPFSWNKDETSLIWTVQFLSASQAFFSFATYNDLSKRLTVRGEFGTSDRHWNMVNLDDGMQSYWSRALFGLECVGIQKKTSPAQVDPAPDLQSQGPIPKPKVPAPKGKRHSSNNKRRVQKAGRRASKAKDPVPQTDEWEVQIKFHWLNRRWGKPNTIMNIHSGQDSMASFAESQINFLKEGCPPPTFENDTIGAVRVKDTLISGHLFTVTMPSLEDATSCKLMLDLQWVLIRIAAMSGAVGYPELLRPPPPVPTSVTFSTWRSLVGSRNDNPFQVLGYKDQ
ncbi:hypothetical protein FPOA_03431 [Fusarium poae]|uniref:HNH nuclease domain-containing protein n=1 Tax=Fusarium poae TaxID=36050 RepID=A0A1B8B9T8_FUSPO|nr:hypothetical protein FPOA_03431 [Fusarium poae]